MDRILRTPSGTTIIVLFIALLITTLPCGCVKIVQKTLAADESPLETPIVTTTAPAGHVTTPPTSEPEARVPELSLVPETPRNLTVQVEPADPIMDGESYATLHAARVNDTLSFNRSEIRLERVPEFEKSYTLGCNATAITVDVRKGPLVIGFDVSTSVDDSGLSAGNRPYFTITVRDNETHRIVAEDGYGREFSSEKSDRSITVYGAGKYHITLEGCFVTVNVAIVTGNSPLKDTGSGTED